MVWRWSWQMRILSCLLASLLLNSCWADGKEKLEFEKKKIVLGKVGLTVEVADSDARRAQGLMYRQKMGEHHGMLFIFPKEERRSFWMKNTYIPLSIGFFDKNQKLLQVLDMKPMTSVMEKHTPLYRSHKPAKYALEVNQGWFKKNKIPLGTKWEWAK